MTRLIQCIHGFTEFLQIIIKLLKSLQIKKNAIKIKYKLYKTYIYIYIYIINIFNIRLIKISNKKKS